MEEFEAVVQRMKQAYERESGSQVEDVSLVGLRLRTLAGEICRLEAALDWLERQAFPQTATGERLDLHGAQRGVARGEAVRATGVVSFSRYLPLSFDLVVPEGTICATSGEPVVEYRTTQEAVLEAGALTVDIPVEAVVAGAGGNAAAGYVTTLVDAPTGINYAANESPITGGRDAEGDEAYRRRILEAYGRSPNGSNAGYYQEEALRFPGVELVQVVPRASGAGTVALYLWGEGAAPSPEVLSQVQAALEAQREVGVSVTVQAATKVTTNVQLSLKPVQGVDFAQAKPAAEAAVQAYFQGLDIGEGYTVAGLSRAVLNAVPLEKLEFPESFLSMPGMKGMLYRPNVITVEELA